MSVNGRTILWGSIIFFVIGIILIAVSLIIWAATGELNVWFWILLILGGIMAAIAFLVLLYAIFVVKPREKELKLQKKSPPVKINEY